MANRYPKKWNSDEFPSTGATPKPGASCATYRYASAVEGPSVRFHTVYDWAACTATTRASPLLETCGGTSPLHRSSASLSMPNRTDRDAREASMAMRTKRVRPSSRTALATTPGSTRRSPKLAFAHSASSLALGMP